MFPVWGLCLNLDYHISVSNIKFDVNTEIQTFLNFLDGGGECWYSRAVTSGSYYKKMKIARNDFQEIFL